MTDLGGDFELIEEFVVEGREALEVIDESLLSLENTPDDLGLVAEIFRRMHSVKGAAGFLGLQRVESLSHAGESLLARVRDGELVFTEDIASALLELMDVLRELFTRLETTGNEGETSYEDLRATLERLLNGDSAEAAEATDAKAEAETPADAAVGEATEGGQESTEEPGEAEVAPVAAEAEPAASDDPAEPSDPTVTEMSGQDRTAARSLLGQILISAKLISEAQLQKALAVQQGGDNRRLGEVIHALGYARPDDIERVVVEQLRNLGVETGDQPAQSGRTASESSIRVDIDLLDGIVGLVGELVLTRNQIVQAADEDTATLARRTQELAYITSSLQEQALRTRMQRVENAWRSLPRVLRDVAKVADKKAALEMSGEGIELDRTIIEAIRDPLVHLVRNAVDHGLESPSDRVAVGKPESGTIRLSAIQDGGHVIIEVADDGGGIDPERIAAAALEKKLVTPAELDTMSDSEKVNLILAPGFSTASQVTKISGRGVGMDVVASNIKEIRGSLEISSQIGIGTTIRLAIPLTLAIVPALVVTCGGELFAVPQASVVELVRLQGRDLEERVDWIHSAPVLQLREQLLPLVEMTDVLDMPRVEDREAATIIVVQSGDKPFGIIVDRVAKAEEIVVKPLSGQVQKVGVYAGATVMGDGSAALILDVTAIARQCNLAAAGGGTNRVQAVTTSESEAILTVMVGDRRVGLATAELERLEKVDRAKVEWSGDEAVVQYRGRLLPLMFLSEVLDHQPHADADGPLRVVVTSEKAETSIGLVVDQVRDVVDIDPNTTDRLGGKGRPGVVGSVVADGSLTELLDVPALIAMVDAGPLHPDISPTPDPETSSPDAAVGSAA